MVCLAVMIYTNFDSQYITLKNKGNKFGTRHSREHKIYSLIQNEPAFLKLEMQNSNEKICQLTSNYSNYYHILINFGSDLLSYSLA
jgi:hypothetical protein